MKNSISKVNENNYSDKILKNQYNIGKGGIVAWFSKVGLLMDIQFKKLIKTPMLLFGVFGIPLIMLFGIGALVQDGALLNAAFGMEAIVVSGIVFGDLYYTIERSTMEKSTSTSNYGHKTKLFAIAVSTLVITIIAITFEMLIFITFDVLGWFFMSSFVFFGSEHYQALTIEWQTIQWLNVIYYNILNILLTVAMFVFVKNFFASNKTFIMFVLTYVLLDIMFGGVLVMNYNAAVVEIGDNGQIYATNEIANQKVLLGEAESAWNWNSWYSYTKFIIPHYFLNQQFSTLLKAGSHQDMQVFYFDANGLFHVNWNVGLNESGELIDGFEWMIDAQNMILGKESKLFTDKLMNNEEFAVAYSTVVASGDFTNVYEAFYTYNKALPIDANFWKAYDSDYTFTLSIILPMVYTVVLGWIGFALSRVEI